MGHRAHFCLLVTQQAFKAQLNCYLLWIDLPVPHYAPPNNTAFVNLLLSSSCYYSTYLISDFLFVDIYFSILLCFP